MGLNPSTLDFMSLDGSFSFPESTNPIPLVPRLMDTVNAQHRQVDHFSTINSAAAPVAAACAPTLMPATCVPAPATCAPVPATRAPVPAARAPVPTLAIRAPSPAARAPAFARAPASAARVPVLAPAACAPAPTPVANAPAPRMLAPVAPPCHRFFGNILTNELTFQDGQFKPDANRNPRNGDYIDDLDKNAANTQALFNDLRSLFPSQDMMEENNNRANQGLDIKTLRDLVETKKLYQYTGRDTTWIDAAIAKIEGRLF